MSVLLIVEDDLNLCNGLTFLFESEDYQVQKANDIKNAHRIFQSQKIDCVLLDCNLPDGDGFTFCKDIRRHSDVPIIMLTARSLEIDEVTGFLIGANDYITKPFSLSILKARVKAALKTNINGNILYSNNITIDRIALKAYKDDKNLDLSSVEYKLLCYLIENKGQILLKNQILDYIWDTEDGFVDANILSVNIRRLRIKIEDNPSEPCYIKTAYRMGYVWNEVS
ncbi:MAG: response regulator transcription factor [Velocimicrobium sp.]